jgi:hypothetical protein
MLALVIEGLVMLREQSQASQFYPLAEELVGTETLVLLPIRRFTQTIAGLATAAAHQWEAAEGHFRTAMLQAGWALPGSEAVARIDPIHH